jgi:D-psicose/D-tagatose/L-ribulose 3-epimerase
MKLVVSNIAWTSEEEPDVAALLRSLGVQYVEVAPTRQWQDPTQTPVEELAAYRAFWAGYGIEVVAFQSMLFNRPDLKLFENESLRQETLEYLKRFIALAPQLGAGVMVFGSPKNRQKGQLPDTQAQAIAKDFFTELGDAATASQTYFCIEPNPMQYACDFVTTAQQGIDFVKAVGNPGFGLHLDLAGMALAGDNVGESIRAAGPLLKHFHISAPFLEQVEARDDVPYAEAIEALRGVGYDRFVSIEMKPETAGSNAARVEKAVRFAQSTYA